MFWARAIAVSVFSAAMVMLGTVAPAGLGGVQRSEAQGAEGSFVLRATGMPRSFTAQLMEADAPFRMIDTKVQVASLSQADVWVIGLEDWAAIDWLRPSPIYGLFAQPLKATDAATPYRRFNWRLQGGRQVDLFFVNLGHVAGAEEACIASTIYALSRAGVAARRGTGPDLLRAHPMQGTLCENARSF